jgi:kinetochore protein Mis12/MTW1
MNDATTSLLTEHFSYTPLVSRSRPIQTGSCCTRDLRLRTHPLQLGISLTAPQSLIDDIINSINNLIYQAISSLESGLLNTPPERLGFSHDSSGPSIAETDEDGNVVYPEAKLEIENGLHQLETLLEANVDKAFDKFEIYVLRNILTVPGDLLSWVRLTHYEVCGFNHEVLGSQIVGIVIETACINACPARVSLSILRRMRRHQKPFMRNARSCSKRRN